MSDFREEEALGKAYDAQLLRRLMTYLRPYRGSVVFAVFLTLLVGPLEVVGPYLFGFGIDRYLMVVIVSSSVVAPDNKHWHTFYVCFFLLSEQPGTAILSTWPDSLWKKRRAGG